jgi:hypothetical protein
MLYTRSDASATENTRAALVCVVQVYSMDLPGANDIAIPGNAVPKTRIRRTSSTSGSPAHKIPAAAISAVLRIPPTTYVTKRATSTLFNATGYLGSRSSNPAETSVAADSVVSKDAYDPVASNTLPIQTGPMAPAMA